MTSQGFWSKQLVSAMISVCSIGMMLCMTVVPVSAQGMNYPAQQIQVVVPFPPGGSADYFARSIFNRLGSVVGQPIVIENKAGGGGIIGAKSVIASPADGYTLLVSSIASVLVPPYLSTPPAFDARKDLTPVTGIGTVPAVLVVSPTLNVKTFKEFLAYAQANPGKLNLATSGAGTISDLTGELLMRQTGVKVVPVHYRGAPPAVTDLLGGHAQFMFSDAPFFLEHIKAGKLVPLAVGTPERSPSLPDVPTTAELGYPSIVASNTYSLFGPAGMPSEVVGKLNDLVLNELRQSEVQEAFSTQAATPAGASPAAFAAQIQAEADRWLPIVQAAGIKAN
jgi:tripartite-type tricarboxylate transporter receptor subunit TctC